MRPPILRVLQTHELKILFGRLAQRRATHTFHFQPEHHVLHGGKPRKQFGVLKHHATIMAAAVRTDECNNLAVLDREVDAVEGLHMMNLAVHAQGKALGNVEEGHLTHSFLQNAPSQWPTTCSAFSRYSGAVTVFRSSGAFKRPAFTI